MGSSQSTRRLTISNEEEAGVIKVSNTLIRRLASANKDVPPEKPKAVVKPPPPVQPAPTQVPAVQMPPTNDGSGREIYYCTDLTLSALQTQQQKERQIQELNEHWQAKLEELEENYSSVRGIMDEEYQKAVKEYQSGKEIINSGQVQPPCQDRSAKVLKCYQDHPNEILKCSSVVDEFSRCVDQCRTNVIATRC